MIETAISVVSSKALLTLFGACDQHLRRIRDALGVQISARDGRIYMRRYRPAEYAMHARPIDHYPARSRQAAAGLTLDPHR